MYKNGETYFGRLVYLQEHPTRLETAGYGILKMLCFRSVEGRLSLGTREWLYNTMWTSSHEEEIWHEKEPSGKMLGLT